MTSFVVQGHVFSIMIKNASETLTSESEGPGLWGSMEKSSDLGTAGPAPAAEAHVAWVLLTQKTRSPNPNHSPRTPVPEPKREWEASAGRE